MAEERQEYKGHLIELRATAGPMVRATATPSEAAHPAEELLIDSQPVTYGQLPDGLYYLEENAYNWSGDLVGLARDLIDYRERRKHR